MATHFQNPSNGYVETGSTAFSWLWCLLFGFIYFAVKGNWRHAIISLVLAIITAGISWLIYPFFVYGINRNHYGRMGWVETP